LIPIKLNMEELLEAVSQQEDNLGENFLDTCTGEVIYIPTEVAQASKNGTLKEESFDSWLEEFVTLAILIKGDKVNRYLRVPTISDDFYIDTMHQYTNTIINNADLVLELHNALKSKEPIKSFKYLLMDGKGDIDEWYKYEDKCVEEFIKAWLKVNKV
jgi:hypothetical protein